eukprot:4425498-Amphidinium_carterae.1
MPSALTSESKVWGVLREQQKYYDCAWQASPPGDEGLRTALQVEYNMCQLVHLLTSLSFVGEFSIGTVDGVLNVQRYCKGQARCSCTAANFSTTKRIS